METLLRPNEVAERLGVCRTTAAQIMRELPHINVSQDRFSTRPRLRITEETLDEYLHGQRERGGQRSQKMTDVSHRRQGGANYAKREN